MSVIVSRGMIVCECLHEFDFARVRIRDRGKVSA